MTWLSRMFRARQALESKAVLAGEDLLRAGFECEMRGDAAGAEEHYRKVPDGDPAQHQAFFFLARRALADRRVDEAITLFQAAAERCPDEALYQLALGDALCKQLRYAEALHTYSAARDLLPEALVVCSNYAGALIHLNRRELARLELQRLLELSPDAYQLHFNLAGIYREFCRTDEAIAEYRRALELNPRHAPSYSNLLLELNMSWSLTAEAIAAEHRAFGDCFATAYDPIHPDRAWPRRLRIGYVSPDLRNHVVSKFMRPILASHDHERFEIYCYHTYVQKDRVTEALRPLADHWIDCEDLSDSQLAERVRADRIDILVDLAGHTAENRMLTFTYKPAPVQATYLGYPNTTGLTTIDYRITDAIADPPGRSDALSTETLARLPGSYFCFAPDDDPPEVEAPPALQNGFVTFGCFNHFAKVSRPFLDTVSRVLHAVPRSRFILKGRPLSLAEVRSGVEEHFRKAGIDLSRIDLRGWEPDPQSHLRIYNAVDIALDTFPYSGATTTCEALWMGAAIVSLAGERHAGRMCASILTSVGLGDWVTPDVDAYVAKCVEASTRVERLAELRSTMRERLKRSLLLDPQRFTRNLEASYLDMWQRNVVAPEARRRAVPRAELLAEARGLRASGRITEAAEACRTLLRAAPDDSEALEILWEASFDASAPGIAIQPLVRALEMRPQDSRLNYMMGCSLQAQGAVQASIAAFRRAIALDPALAKAHNNLGCMLEAARETEDALAAYAKALELDATLTQSRWNLGDLRARAGDIAGAVGDMTLALQNDPRNSAWHCRLAELRLARDERDEALANFRRAVELDPSDIRAHTGLAFALFSCGFVEEAATFWEKALALDPRNAGVESWLLFSRHFRRAQEVERLFEEHKGWARRHTRTQVRFTTRKPNAERPRLNIGYVASGFQSQLFARFVAPVLAAHDRTGFQIYCYSTAPESKDGLSALRAMDCAPRDISALDDLQAADRIRADSVDILVDLSGHSGGGRMLLFGLKPAPVQVTWLGYPNGTGLPAMNYRITDAIADPPGPGDACFVETPARLAKGLLCFSPPPEAPAVAPVPQLSRGNVTFGSFNNLAKVSDDAILLWARVLKSVPGSRLLLKAHAFASLKAREHVVAAFGAQGIDASRVEFRPAEPSYVGHLQTYAHVDVALDVFPYNGGTTTCEALWMGVPVVTLAGAAHASRLGASILAGAGLQEWVAHTAEEYVTLASRLANDAQQRQILRQELRPRLASSPLLDVSAFTRGLESSYRDMWSSAVAGRSARPATPISVNEIAYK